MVERAVSDYGGKSAGPVDRDEHPATLYEKRVDAIKNLVSRLRGGLMTSDVSRRTQEELPAADYDALRYYDRWLVALRRNLVELGLLSEAEIEQRLRDIKARQGGTP
jgi:Nitrile hydratase beta subunit